MVIQSLHIRINIFYESLYPEYGAAEAEVRRFSIVSRHDSDHASIFQYPIWFPNSTGGAYQLCYVQEKVMHYVEYAGLLGIDFRPLDFSFSEENTLKTTLILLMKLGKGS